MSIGTIIGSKPMALVASLALILCFTSTLPAAPGGAPEECLLEANAVGGGAIDAQAGGGPDPQLSCVIAGDLSFVRMENSELLIEFLPFSSPHVQFAIKKFVIKAVGQDQMSSSPFDYLGAGAGIGSIDSATVTYDGADRKTIRMVWNRWNVSTQTMNPNQKIIRDLTIYANSRYIQVDFVDIKYAINLADLARPGGTSGGNHVAHGADEWPRGLLTHDESPGVFYSRYGPDGVDDPVDGGSLNYNDHFVTAVYNPANGVGFGRVMPIAHTHVIKLLLNPSSRRGLEFQNYPFLQGHPPFTGYIYAFTGGETEALELGRSLADQSFATAACGDEIEISALPYTNWGFLGWSGDATGNASPLPVTLDTPLTSITGTFIPAPAPLGEDFESYAVGADPADWEDTGANNGLGIDDSLFEVQSDADGQYLATDSAATNIHSHVTGVALPAGGYYYTGRMRITDSQGGVGVTFFSQYPAAQNYYRLRRFFSNGFQLTAGGTSFTGGTTELGVVPTTDTWYRFTVLVEDTGTETLVKARVWADGNPEPSDWQAEAVDASGSRHTGGTVGVWTFTSGSKHFDELIVRSLTPPLDMDLTTNVVGQGVVTRTPDQPAFAFGDEVTVEAVGDLGWIFDSWSGDIVSTQNPLTFTLSADVNITANFIEVMTHVVDTSVVGLGVVNVTPDLIQYETGDPVTFEAIPVGGWSFLDWTGDLAGQPNPTTIEITDDITAAATFTELTATYTESFDGYAPGSDPVGWADTAANNSLAPADFFDVRDAVDPYLGTNSSSTNIHSHLTTLTVGSPGYQFTGRMRIGNSDAGIGVTFFSQFTDSAGYYRLRRFGSGGSFHFAPVGTSVVGETDTGVIPNAGVWYRFRIEVESGNTTSTMRARIWLDTEAEPTIWQAEATDNSGSRFMNGTIGVWSYLSGEKCWDDLEVLPLTDTPPPVFTLDVTPTGNGTVSIDPDLGDYDAGTLVQLTATPDANWQFIEWTGDATGSENPLDVTMNSNKNITAVFAEIVQHNVSTTVIGQGTVTADPADATVETGTSVTFTATPDLGWFFVGWQGALSSTANRDSLVITSDVVVTAVFQEITQHTIDVTLAGPGVVTFDPDLAVYDLGDLVTLTAVPDPGFIFTGWSGDVTSNLNPLDLTVDGDLALVATFEPEPEGYEENFQSYASGDNPNNWFDTDSFNAMTENDSLFDVFQEGSNLYLGTASTATNIHSHLIDTLLPATGYRYAGRMKISNSSGGVGVTFFSTYPDANRYYRLRRFFSNDFHITANGTSITGGQTETGVVPSANQWYRFVVEVEDSGARTEIRAKAWRDGTAEPANWQAECYDDGPGRLVDGTIGVWSFHNGNKCWDDITVDPIGAPQPPAEDLVLGLDVGANGAVLVDPDLALYTEGDVVTLTALPDAGFAFAGWGGDASGTTNPLEIVMTSDVSISASFFDPSLGYFENFESTPLGGDPVDWFDTGRNNSLAPADDFYVANIDTLTLHTDSNATNIHTHYTGALPAGGYEFSGRMRASSSSGGIGVTFFSDFPNSVTYYRLRRYFSNSFHLTAAGTSITGDKESDVVPQAGQWYRFRIEVEDTGTQTEIRARVWLDGTAEPSDWSIDCVDASATRLVSGTIGAWSFYNGTKSWDDFQVIPLAP